MEVKQFFEILDEIRFDDSIDAMNPELRPLAQKCFPILRKLYNMMLETDLLAESKQSTIKLTESDMNYIVMEATNKIIEAHGYIPKKGFKDDFGKMKNPKINKPVSKFNYKNYDADMDESIDEAHGSKKHNMPKDKDAAARKGNREAEKDIYGDGFKSKDKIHNPKGYSRKNNKINVNDIEDSMDD